MNLSAVRCALLTPTALAVGLTILAAPASAQEGLTLEGAIAEALARHPALVAAVAAADEARARADEARAAWWPSVTVADAWQRGTQPVFAFSALVAARAFAEADFAANRLNRPGAISAMTGGVVLRQAVFDAGTRAGVATGTAGDDAARAALDEERAGVALEVTRAYGRLLAALSAEAAASSSASAARDDLLRAERRRDAGLATDADVLAFSVHVAAMDRRRIAAAGDVTIGRATLNRLTGQPMERAFSVSEPTLPTAETASPTDLLREADTQRPELRRRDAERRAAEAGHRLARAAWLPRVTAQAGYQADGLEFLDRAGSWTVGGEVAWTLSLGGAEHARLRAARAAVAAADAIAADTRARLRLEVITALATLDTARARITAGARARADATERERITRNRYEAGLAGATDMLAAAAATLDAEAERVAALVDAVVARAELDRALGRPVGDHQP